MSLPPTTLILNQDYDLTNVSKQFTVKLKSDMEIFSYDKYTQIKSYINRTDFKSILIFTMIGVKEILMKSKNPQLNQSLQNINQDIIEYLNNRIVDLNNVSITQKKEIAGAAFHIQDIIFSIGEVAKYNLQEGIANAFDELQVFNESLLNKCIKILVENHALSNENISSTIFDLFASLEADLLKKDFSQTRKDIEQIKQIFQENLKIS